MNGVEPEPVKELYCGFPSLMRKFNTVYSWYCVEGEKGSGVGGKTPKECHEVVDVPVIDEGSHMVDRILDLFTDAYKQYSIAYLGYKEYSDIKTKYDIKFDKPPKPKPKPKKKGLLGNTPELPEPPEPIEEEEEEEETEKTMTVDQILNSQFGVNVEFKEPNEITYFNINRFRNRPIFCGVNVLYDPVLTTEFKDSRKDESYFNQPWSKEYELSKYNDPNDKNAIIYRDISYSKEYLTELQNEAGEKPLVFALVRKGYSLGIGALRPNMLDPTAQQPSQYCRVFDVEKSSDNRYNIIMPFAKVMRTYPKLDTATKDIIMTEGAVVNNMVYQIQPPTKDTNELGGKGSSSGGFNLSEQVKYPVMAFVGENLDEYDMVSYMSVPLCSWSHFIGPESGYAGTKAVDRLESTGSCGPFAKITAKGYYSSAVSMVMSTACTIVLEKADKFIFNEEIPATLKSVKITEAKNDKGEVIWTPYYGFVSHRLQAACICLMLFARMQKFDTKQETFLDTVEEFTKIEDIILHGKEPFFKELVNSVIDTVDKGVSYVADGVKGLLGVGSIGEDGSTVITETESALGYIIDYINKYKINENTKVNVKIANLLYADEKYRDNYAYKLFQNSYVRGDPNNPLFIDALFDEVTLPDRFSFYTINGEKDKIYINQYPCIPVVNAKPMQSDYVTQLMPLYRKKSDTLEPTKSKNGQVKDTIWYLNPNDILIGGIRSSFYNVNTQEATMTEYPKDAENKWRPFIYTCTGHAYRGPEKDEDGKKIPGLPDHICVVNMSDIGGISEYTTEPLTIAPGNTLTYMTGASDSDFTTSSRRAYKEYIRNGCVFADGDTGTIAPEPSRVEKEYIPKERNPLFGACTKILEEDPEESKKVRWAIYGSVFGVIAIIILICCLWMGGAFRKKVKVYNNNNVYIPVPTYAPQQPYYQPNPNQPPPNPYGQPYYPYAQQYPQYGYQ